MKLTGAAILVSRGMKVLQAAPAAYPYRYAAWSNGGRSLPTDDELAQLFGLSRWCLGGLPPSPGRNSFPLEVRALWRVVAEPSFDSSWVLAGLIAEPDEDETSESIECLTDTAILDLSKNVRLYRKGVLVWENETAFATLETDPVADALNRIALLQPQTVMALDGIGYRVRVETDSLRGEFAFDNPLVLSLKTLEKAFLDVAEIVARSSSEKWPAAVLRLWSEYAGEST